MITEGGLAGRVREILEPVLVGEGYRLVQVKLEGGVKYRILQILAEPIENRAMNVDDCRIASRAVSAVLDVEDVIPTAYTLELSSPGIDRPLIAVEDFLVFMGLEVKVETSLEVSGRKNFKGRIKAVENDEITVAVHDGDFTIPFAKIAKAKLVYNDELVEFSKKRYLKELAN